MATQPDTRFNFKEVEPKMIDLWEKEGCFRSAVTPQGEVIDQERASKNTFVIAIPPPNVTGRLHMGHALNNTLQDVLIRYYRMNGDDALWIPGTDHAGIATQTVVKKMLDEEGVDYHALGREKFVERVWEWKRTYGDIILKQLEGIGCSCDWERTRFTMDEGLSKAVTHAFKRLYDEGLIYRGKRIVNWCPVDRTALSDDEVEIKEGGESGFLWQVKYPFVEGSGHLVVATTRPETLFGDVAVAVNSKDKRYKHLIGKKVIVPLQGRVVPIIADDYVDLKFGTGCLKITPAHDPYDFEVAGRHNLEPISVMNEDATMNDVVPEKYRGLDRFKCREAALEELKEKDLLVSEEPRMTPLGRSYRSKEIIEYRLSDQWFIKMKPLAEKALKHHAEFRIIPERWEKVYLSWMENIRDWCISRQIWWGHRVPAWYCVKDEHTSAQDHELTPVRRSFSEGGSSRAHDLHSCPPIVSETVPTECPHCGSKNLIQETDVLDTWFSSALWPMSVLGWPERTPDFKRYFPTTTLVTAKDIIFFWVARMNCMAVHFEGKMPYRYVYINPVVLDEKGETMSKSKGNGIDPLVIINGATLEELKKPVMESRPTNMKDIIKRLEKNFPEGYEGVGADALRYTLVYLCSSGQQMKVSLTTFHEIGRRFMTKLWNAARFIFMYVEQEKGKSSVCHSERSEESPEISVGRSFANAQDDIAQRLTDEDRWIQARLQLTVNKVRRCYKTYDFTNLGQVYYQYVWNDFCDWYIELCKVRLNSEDVVQRRTALHNLIETFTSTLVLLSPLIPFVTEELWSRLCPKSGVLMMQPFPKALDLTKEQGLVVEKFEKLQQFVSEIRSLRKTYQIKDGEKLTVFALALDDVAKDLVTRSAPMIARLANLATLTLVKSRKEKPAGTVTILDPSFEIYLDLSKYIDVGAEKTRIKKEIEQLEKHTQSLNQRLQNVAFVQNAKPEVVEEQRASLATQQEQVKKLKQVLKELL